LAGLSSFVAELKRRRVIRALLGWGIVSFAVLQVFEPVMHGLHLPEWTLGFVVVVLALGFPVTATLAWVFDLTTSGIERTRPVREPEGGSAAPRHSRGARAALLLGMSLAAAAPGLVYYFFWPGPGRHAVGGSSAGQGARGVPSIAVLPFVDMSPQRDQEYFADGISEEILNALAQVEVLRVIGRTSSFSFKGKPDDLKAIGEKLNVDTILQGSVRKEGSRVRVSAQIVHPSDGRQSWARTFDREMSGVFAIQDEISSAVVEVLRVELLPGRVPPPRRETSPETFNQFLLGRHALNRASAEGFHAARAAFERAVTLDPGYAPAWAWLAYTLDTLVDLVPSPAERSAFSAGALSAADRAIAIDPSLAEGFSIRGYVKSRAQKWADALSDLDRAVALNPSDVQARIGRGELLAALGRVREGVEELRQACALDPLSAAASWRLGWLHSAVREFDLAREALNRSLEIAPDQLYAARTLGIVELLDGHLDAAARAFERSPVEPFRLMGAALVEHERGHREASQQALDRLVAHPYALVNGYQIAEVYAWRGELDAAMRWLESSLDRADGGMWYVKYDPLLHLVRGEARYAALLRRMGLPVE
jgi:serine/threonine-protein kinase